MAEEMTSVTLEPCPEKESIKTPGPCLHIGLLGNYPDSEETRFLLTPEACGLLTSSGFEIKMESGAGVDIDFPDEKYAEFGVKIVSREEALQQHKVLSYAPLKAEDIRKMRKGSALLCIMHSTLFEPDVIKALLENNITLGCLDNMYSHSGDCTFANIIDEIDGRAAVMYAQEHLSYLGGGKGVLLAGVAGINPCEVLIVGDGMQVWASARAALDAGAIVTVVNNDIAALQAARQYCGQRLLTLAIHPRVLFNKIKSADVILIGTPTRPLELPRNLYAAMKDSAFVLDFKESHPSVSVPRTVAMGLSNLLVNFFSEMQLKNGINGMIATSEGVQHGIVTYEGKLVDKLVASYLGMPCVDISVMIAHRN